MADNYSDILVKNSAAIDKITKHYKEEKAAKKAKDKELITYIHYFLRELVFDEKLTNTMEKMDISKIQIYGSLHPGHANFYLTANGTISYEYANNSGQDSHEEEYVLQKITNHVPSEEKKPSSIISECFKDNKVFIKKQKHEGKHMIQHLAHNYLNVEYNDLLTIEDIKKRFNYNLEKAILTKSNEIKK